MTAWERIKPRVRLMRMRPTHVRASELLRYFVDAGGVASVDSTEMYERLAFRGVLDPLNHFERYRGTMCPTAGARAIMFQCVRDCLDMGLIEPFRPDDSRYRNTYMVTRDGKETLADWDDPDAEGLWA